MIPRIGRGGRYADILGMARRGATNEEIMAAHSGVDDGLCEVYRKIVNGTTADLGGIGAQRSMSNGARRRLYMLELSAAGFDAEEIAQKTGASLRTVREAIFGSQERTR